MKKALLIIVLLMSCSGNIFAQAEIDSANIVREIVKQQIINAREKQKSSLSESRVLTIPVTTESNLDSKQQQKESFKISPLGIKLLILVFASIIAFSYVFINRKRTAKIEKNKEFKANIKKIRNEQLIVSIDPRLKAIRKKLVLNASYLNSKDTAKFVKENKLGLSEITLAAKLREYETAVSER